MANTAESIAQQNAPIQQALKETSALAQEYSKISSKYADATGIRESGEVSQAHTALFLQTAKLLRTVRGPVDMIYSHFENVRISVPNNITTVSLRLYVCFIDSLTHHLTYSRRLQALRGHFWRWVFLRSCKWTAKAVWRQSFRTH